MSTDDQGWGGFQFDTRSVSQLARALPVVLLVLMVAYVLWKGFYTVDAHERAVVLRFGKFSMIEGPGLHFKLPLVDVAVPVDTAEHSMRLPWGTTDVSSSGQGLRVFRPGQDESLILTGDLYAGVVEWNVIWRVAEPDKFLFSIEADHVQKVITAAARSTMNRIVGDYSADEILTGKREEIGLAALQGMQAAMKSYECGVDIVDLQMQRVTPPERVKPAFDDVNASIQKRDQLVNEANQERFKLIPLAQAEADKLIREAEGYAARRRAEAQGEISALTAKYRAYKEAPDITRKRMYLESMEKVIANSGPKTVLDGELRNLLPLLNLGDSTAQPSQRQLEELR